MHAKPLVHPEKDRLFAFGLGKLEQSDATEIESHLKECPDCCETLLDLKDDTFVALVRESVDPSSPSRAAVSENGARESPNEPTVKCADKSVSPIEDAFLPSNEPESSVTVPRELADHPRYRIVELIGKGGMGVVYKAEHRLMNRIVALKVINQKLVRNIQAVERFRREVQAAARLSHPNIVTAHDAERAGNVHYLVTEYVDGTDLAEVIRQGGPLEIRKACEYVKQAAEGLQHAYEKRMVHRDIKPHNLIVTADGRIKILDFGLATLLAAVSEAAESNDSVAHDPSTSAPHLTTFGTMMGTPDFISPEQADDSRSVDIRSDIYSLGCTFYYLLTGRPPFDKGSATDKLKAHTGLEAEPIESVRTDIPLELAVVIRRMMAKNPGERFQTPAEIVQAMTPFAVPRQNDQEQPPAQLRSVPRRRFPVAKWLVGAGMTASLFVAAAVFFVQLQKTIIRFEVEDPKLTVSFGDDSVTINDNDRQFIVAPGTKQRFVVKQDGKDLETDIFTLKKGQKVALRIKLVDGDLSVAPSDGSVSIVKADDASLSVDDWVERLKGLREHMNTAFVVGPELLLLDPDKELEILRKAWPSITAPEVKMGLLKAFSFNKALQPKKHPLVLRVLDLGMTDPDPKINAYAAAYLQEYASEDFSGAGERYAAWYRKHGDKSPEQVIQFNQANVPESLKKQLDEIEVAMGKGDLRKVSELAAKLGTTPHPAAIPTLIGLVDADNSYETVYGVGYFGLGKITGIDYSPYHDGTWWRRWWAKNKVRFPKEAQLLRVPEFAKTEHGKSYQPFPEDLDTLSGKLNYFKHLEKTRSNITNWATEVSKHKDPAVIPYLVGVIDADNTNDTVYGVGYFGLGKLTGVKYDETHDGAWWRKWWEENKSKYSAEVQAIAIPDLHAEFTVETEARQETAPEDPLKEVADIPANDLRIATNKKMRYFLIGPREGATVPQGGFKLVIVLPGGDGSEKFHPFVRRLYKNAMSNQFLVAQPVAFKWRPNQEIVWPTRKHSVEGQEFATEDFVEAVVLDVATQYRLDKKSIYTLSWSSGGPAAYAIALAKDTPVTGSYIAMSVFKPESLPPLEGARGRAFFIDHSPTDHNCAFSMAENAKTLLKKSGANVRFNTYEGGHGWHGDVFGRVRGGIEWLQRSAASDK